MPGPVDGRSGKMTEWVELEGRRRRNASTYHSTNRSSSVDIVTISVS